MTTSLDHVSLVQGTLPWAVACIAGASTAVVVWRSRRPRWHAALAALVATGVAVAFSAAIDLPNQLRTDFPPIFFLLAALPITAAFVTARAWRGASWTVRTLGVVSVISLATFGAIRVDAYCGYLPTVGDLLGAPVPGQVASTHGHAWRRYLERVVHGTPASAPIGTVAPIAIPPTVSGFHARGAWVWLPPVWFTAHHPALPVVELLSGTPGDPRDWMRGGHAIETLDRLARTHDGWGPVVVIVDENGSFHGDTECVNRPSSQPETYVTVDVVHAVAARFGVAPTGWSIVGDSEGGTCALTLALRHPALYQSFGDYAGDPAPNLGDARHSLRTLYDGSIGRARSYDPGWLLRRRTLRGVRAGFCVGNEPRRRRSIAVQAQHARADGATTRVWRVSTGHDFYTWSSCFARSIDWLAETRGDHDPGASLLTAGGPAGPVGPRAAG